MRRWRGENRRRRQRRRKEKGHGERGGGGGAGRGTVEEEGGKKRTPSTKPQAHLSMRRVGPKGVIGVIGRPPTAVGKQLPRAHVPFSWRHDGLAHRLPLHDLKLPFVARGLSHRPR